VTTPLADDGRVGLTDVTVGPAVVEQSGTWALIEGTVTVFLASVRDGSPGRRTPVAVVDAPAVVALPEAPSGRGWVLGRSRASLRPIEESGWDPATTDAAVRTTSELLLGVVRTAVSPPVDRVTRIGTRPTFVSAGRAASVDQLRWVRPVEGQVRLGGVVLRPDGAPVGPHLPLVDPTSFAVLSASPLDDVAAPEAVEGVRWLWSVACAVIVESAAARAETERQVVERARDADVAIETGAVRLLVREITEDGAPAMPVVADPLVACATIVGHAAGFEVVAPRGGFRGREGTSAMRALATSSGLFVRTVVLDSNWMAEAVEPMIGFRPDGAPVAIVFRRSTAFLVEADGTEHAAGAPDAPEIINKAFVFSKPPGGTDFTGGSLLRRAMRGQAPAVRASLLWSVVLAAVTLTVPLASGVVFGEIIPSGDTARLLWLIVCLVAAAAAVLPLQIAATAANSRLEATVSLNLQRGIWARVLRSPVTLVHRLGPGDLTVRLSALEGARDTVEQLVLGALPTMIGAFIAVFVLFLYAPSLAWFALAWAAVVLTVSVGMAIRVAKAQRETDIATGEVNGFLFQVLGAIPKLHVAGAEARAFAAWAERFRGAVGQRLTVASAHQVLLGAVLGPMATLVLFMAVALTNSIDQVGTFIAFQMTYGLFLGGISAFTGALAVLIQQRPALERAVELVNQSAESGLGRTDPGPLRGDVSLRNLSFRYQPDSPMVLDGLDLDIAAGQMVAIVGHSGCGKSTILRLLLGFEQPEQGSVLFDNQDLATLDVESVRRQLGVVLQDGQLMPGSIFQNLSGSATISEADAWDLAELVALADDIKAMPMKLETMTTMNGGAFSGGQRQRLLIARALASKPRILLLDEATSALDNVTQRIVTRNLAAVGITRIVVAHRLSTIVDADRIVVLSRGRLAESGTYDELMDQRGAFHALATRQVV